MLARLLGSLLGDVRGYRDFQARRWSRRGDALRDAGRHEDAVAAYGRALRHDPRSPQALYKRGCALLALERLEAAAADYQRAVELQPDYANAHYNLALVLQRLKRLDEALASYDRALQLKPDDAEALNNRGTALSELQREEEAVASYEQALALRPGYVEALHNQALSLICVRRFEEAARPLERLLALDADHPFAEGKLLHANMQCCDWQQIAARAERIRRGIQAGEQVADPFDYLAISESAQDLRRCAEICAPVTFSWHGAPLWSNERYRHSRIRLGYVSGEFRQHATSVLMARLFERHDRNRFELIAFDNGPNDGSGMRARVVRAFDEFVDVTRSTDLQAASAVRERQIDLLIDLNGYCGLNRPGVFACRPSPVHVSYLGWPGTTGADCIDYLIADRHVIPEGCDAHYTEKVVYLPDTYQVNDPGRAIAQPAPTRAEAGLPATGFVFCCFNNNYKITPEVFDIWMRLLREVDGSVLWLLEDNAAASRNLRLEAARRGVLATRLIFAPRIDHARHLARHLVADLFVDTLPYNAHTTACDALWAGLPLVTCMGGTFPGRVAGSLLHAAGLPDLITHSLRDYEALALQLARSPLLLAELRKRLERNRPACALFDVERFRRNIESAYVTMWERCQRGEPPASFAVQA